MTIGKPILAIYNAHRARCGKSPAIVNRATDSEYVGFFESEYGDQFVVEIDRKKKTGTLWASDWGWNKPLTIADGRLHGDCLLNEDESLWLKLCWKAATRELLQVTTFRDLLDVSDDGTVTLRPEFRKEFSHAR